MKNAHLRMATLQFTKVTRDTTIDIRLHMDRMIAEHDTDPKSAHCHLLSVFGNDLRLPPELTQTVKTLFTVR